MNQIWTPQVRRELYRQLVFYYGTLSEWENRATPKADASDFWAFCKSFADRIGAKSARAVMHQIAFVAQGVANPSSLKAGRHLPNYILNMAAAREAGFITDKQLCGFTATSARRS